MTEPEPTGREEHVWMVDAMEEGVAAVLEDGERLRHLPRWLLPPDAREGDILRVRAEAAEGGALRLEVRVDHEATESAYRRSEEQVSDVARSHDPGGDIVL